MLLILRALSLALSGRSPGKSAPRRRSAFCRPRLETLEARVLPATVNWINPAGGDWDTPGDWSTGVLPGAGDDVVIDLPGQNTFAVTHSANVADTVHSLTSNDGLVVSGGSLSVAAASTVAGGFTLTGGTLSGGGTGSLTAQGGAGLDGGTLDGVAVHLQGGSSMYGVVTLANGAVLDNEGMLALSDGATLTHASSDPSVQFTNEGTVQASGTGEMELWAPTLSSGAIEVLAGELDIGDGAGNGTSTFSGTMTAAPGATLYVDAPGGVDNFTPSSSIDAASVIFFNTGTFNVAGAYQAGSTTLDDRYGLPTVTMTGSVSGLGAVNVEHGTILDLSQANLASSATTLPSLSVGGTLVASGAFTVTGPMAAYNSTLLAPAGTTASLTALQGVSLGGTDNNSHEILDGFTVVNPAGRTSDLNYGVLLYDGAVLDNQGTLTVHDTSALGRGDSSNVQFRNEGLLEKLDGTVNAGLNLPIVNTGTIDLESGEMSLGDRAGTLNTSAGPITAAAGTSLELDSNWSITGAIQGDQVQFGGQDSIAGSYSAGATQLFGAQVTMTGTVSALGNLSIPGIGTPFGTLDLSAATLAPAAYTLSGLSFNGGTLVASGAFTVTGPMAAYNSTLLAPAGMMGSITALQGASLGGTDNNTHLILDGFTLVNSAGQTCNIFHGVGLNDGAVLDNEGTLALHGGSSVSCDESRNVQFRNEGLLEKLDGTINAGLDVPIVNTGTIDLESGEMTLGDFAGNLNTSAGPITAAAGTFLGLVGTWAITGAIQADQMEIDGTGQANQVAIAGPVSAVRIAFNANQPSITGTIDADSVTFALGYPQVASVTGSYRSRSGTVISSGTVQFYGAVEGLGDLSIGGGGVADFTPAAGGPVTLTFASLTLTNGAQLTGTDDFVVAGPFAWNGGEVDGAPDTSLTAQGGMTLSGGNLYGRTLVNAGAAAWIGGGVGIYDDASFINTGTFDDQIDGNFGGPDCPLFDNQGLFLKSGGDGTTYLQMMLQNSGTVNIEHGTLELSCGFVQGSGGSISGSVSGSFSNPGQYDSGPSPNPPVLTNYTQTVTGTLDEQIGGLTAGTQYGQIIVNGDVNLAGSLQVALVNSFAPHLNDSFTIIDDRGSNPVNGTFTNLPEGASVWDTTHTYRFIISYAGGDGNDVVLTAQQVATPTPLTASVSPSLFGQPVTLTAVVAAAGAGTPTGSVDFFDLSTSTDLGSVPLSGGSAVVTTGTLRLGGRTITATYSGDAEFLSSSGSTALSVIPPASLSGFVFEDFNGDGQVDFGEKILSGVTVTLTGTDDLGNAVNLSQQTDTDGAYVYLNLRPGNYSLTETQPANYLQGADTVGTAGGSLAATDEFFVELAQGVNGLNYNFGEQPPATGAASKKARRLASASGTTRMARP